MTEKNTIQINPNKPSTIEFEVTISGLERMKPKVRLILNKIQDNIDWIVNCELIEGSKWQAQFPKINTKSESCEFYVEVIVDEYYFKPAEGEILFITSPDVSFDKKDKPKVTTSFNVKQHDEPVKKPEKKKPKVEESVKEIAEEFPSIDIPDVEPIQFTVKQEEPVRKITESILKHTGSLFKKDDSGHYVVK